ncbi:MAG: hypothetical protein JW720_10710, partial [Sedimentisphaerales bacterium]|nr:hypothetical protein [Sedimentisphaerales bacterium]
MSNSDIMRSGNGRYRNRTCDPLIKSQLHENSNTFSSKNLRKAENSAYKPAYKKNSEMSSNPAEEIPQDLAEMV